MGTATLPPPNRRSKWTPHRNWCLAWLILCQFPIPIVHSHHSLAGLNPAAWQAHVETHHPELCNGVAGQLGGCQACPQVEDELHWHWLLPWDLSATGVVDLTHGHARPMASPLGLWGGTAGIDSAAVAATSLLDSEVVPELDICWLEGWSAAKHMLPVGGTHVGRSTVDAFLRPSLNTSFAHSYIGISLIQLIGARLV